MEEKGMKKKKKLFKCIYLWWRLYDRIFDEEEVCE